GDHQVVGMSLGTGWTKGLELIHRRSLERLSEPAASLAQFLFPPHFVEPQNQIDVVMRSLRFHSWPPMVNNIYVLLTRIAQGFVPKPSIPLRVARSSACRAATTARAMSSGWIMRSSCPARPDCRAMSVLTEEG